MHVRMIRTSVPKMVLLSVNAKEIFHNFEYKIKHNHRAPGPRNVDFHLHVL